MAIKDENVEVTIIPPHSANYIRALNLFLVQQLLVSDTASAEVPTILSRAKTLVNKDNVILLYKTKEGNYGQS